MATDAELIACMAAQLLTEHVRLDVCTSNWDGGGVKMRDSGMLLVAAAVHMAAALLQEARRVASAAPHE